jgi:hypothetical protein
VHFHFAKDIPHWSKFNKMLLVSHFKDICLRNHYDNNVSYKISENYVGIVNM